jgi:hypothetical protein
MTPDTSALALAARQGGVLTLAQAVECGLSARSVQYRTQRGEWQRVYRSVYRLIEMSNADDLVRAAVAVLPGAVVSHESAAEIHEIPFVARELAVVSVHTRTTHVFPGVTVHRNHDLAGSHIREISDMPVTTLPRTVFDLSSILSEKHVRSIVDRLIAERRIALQELALVHEEVARRGKPGATALRRILGERADGVEAKATRLELDGLQLIRKGGLPEPVLEYPFPWNTARRFDAAYPRAELAIEWDSRLWHGLIDSFERDRQRDREAMLHGWKVLRFTWRDITERPVEVVETIRAILEQQGVDMNRGP